MTVMPGAHPPLVDPGNALLAAGIPAQLQTGMIPLPAGQVGVATIRTPDVTLSVTLTREDTEEWIRLLTQLRDSMSRTGLITAVAHNAGQSLGPRPA